MQQLTPIRRTYAIALLVIASLLVLSQVVVQSALSEQSQDAELINVAGRQRMLSQRVAKFAFARLSTASGPEELRATLDQFEAGDQFLREAGLRSERLNEMFEDAYPYRKKLIETGELFCRSEVSQSQAVLQDLLHVSDEFLVRMNDIVKQYERESNASLARLHRIEFGLFILLLVAIAAEAMFVFEPMRRTLMRRMEELTTARNEALVAMRARDEFLAMMSHEIRTPLNGLIGINELLSDTDLNDEQRDLLETSSTSADSLLLLLNEVLDFAKLSAGSLAFENIPFRLRELAERAATPLAFQAKEGVEVYVDFDESLPLEAVGDPVRLQQLVTNLGSNAAKFTLSGHIIVRFASCTQRFEGGELEQPGLRIEIEDSGIGIA